MRIGAFCLASLATFALACPGGNAGRAQPTSVEATTGDLQAGPQGLALPNAPTVVVTDANGAPLSGVRIDFAVVQGGGTVEHPATVTDGAGAATAGAWTLGAQGLNRLTATVAGLPQIEFRAYALTPASPDIAVEVVQPSTGTLLDQERFPVVVRIQSRYEMVQVRASAAESTADLAYSSEAGGPVWSGSVSAAGAPFGPLAVRVEAVDAVGGSTETVIFARRDAPPTIRIAAPLDGALANPTVDLAAACEDDDAAGCSAFAVRGADGVVLASGTSSLRRLGLDLSAHRGEAVELRFQATDSGGHTVELVRNVFVQDPTKFAVVATVQGEVCDVSDARVLWLDRSGASPALRLSDVGAGTTLTVASDASLSCEHAVITPAGVMHVAAPVAVQPRFVEWQAVDGAVQDLGIVNGVAPVVAGSYATFLRGTDVVLRDYARGEDVVITHAGVATTVSSDGHVAYLELAYDDVCSLLLFHDGTSTRIAPAVSDHDYLARGLTTDGVHVAYWDVPGSGRQPAAQLMLASPSGAVALDDYVPRASAGALSPLAAGWTAYASTRGSVGGAQQVWRRDPAGAEEKLTVFSAGAYPEAIAPDGTVVLRSDHRRYRAIPGRSLDDVGAAQGRVLFRDERFVVLVGTAVLRILP